VLIWAERFLPSFQLDPGKGEKKLGGAANYIDIIMGGQAQRIHMCKKGFIESTRKKKNQDKQKGRAGGKLTAGILNRKGVSKTQN